MPMCRCARVCSHHDAVQQPASFCAYCGLSVDVILFCTPVQMEMEVKYGLQLVPSFSPGIHHYLILILDLISIHFQMNTHHLSREIWWFPNHKTVWLKRTGHCTVATQQGDEPVCCSAWCFHHQTFCGQNPSFFFVVGGGGGVHTKGWKVPSC